MAFIVRSAKNPKLVLCKDGQFHPESMTGIGGYPVKEYKTKKAAERSCGTKKVVVDATE